MRIRIPIAAALLALALAPALAQGPVETPGPVAHRAAGAVFPERVANFRRTNVYQYDSAGEDMSASYILARGSDRVLVTVYLYPASRLGPGDRTELCRREFGNVTQAILTGYREPQRQPDAAAPAVEGVEPALSHRAAYTMTAPFMGAEQPVRSEAYLYCYVGGDWLVKYRATSHAAFDAAGEIERFIGTGPWPGRPPDSETIAELLLPSSNGQDL